MNGLNFGGVWMGYKLNLKEVNELFNELKKEYIIYAPKRFEKQGRYSDTDIIKYDVINKITLVNM